MKKHLTIIIIIILLIIAAATVGIELYKNRKTPYEGDIISFKYSYGNKNNAYFDCEIRKTKRRTIVTISERTTNRSTRRINGVVIKRQLDGLRDLINKQKIYEWNGFEEIDKTASEIDNFALEVHFSDGRELIAKGRGMYPKDYRKASSELYNYLDGIVGIYGRSSTYEIRR
ncbi:MAG: hypothetical protein IJI58_02185 [Bacilli bacterium]|nr:hypothetical protein [Bacilli bacterium]